jgi:predicted signal transduction protein with EAL and GGDEF domain
VIGVPYRIDGHQLIVGASVGIAIAPTDGEDADVLLKSADLALYRAKADGRGTHRFFETEMDRKLQERRQLEADLREAIAGDQFTLFYQPLVNVRTGAIACMEALVRWHHPRRGLLAPADFIELAENSGQIVQVGEWVLHRACADAAAWADGIKVAVNLSPVQFRNRNLVGAVTAAIRASGLDPTRLELEITESVLLQSTDATLQTLHQLRDLGVRIAMDDFGTGYSSLSYLRSFPFDKIKIDRSFTHDLSSNNQSMAIIRAVAGLGRSLGIATTAEGVETAKQLELLRAEGCTEVQGYLFGQPRPLSELEEMLDARRGERQAGAA